MVENGFTIMNEKGGIVVSIDVIKISTLGRNDYVTARRVKPKYVKVQHCIKNNAWAFLLINIYLYINA